MTGWRTQAACKNLPTHVFYPDKGVNADAAKTVCQRCPVQAECAKDGAHEPHGIWGGMSPLERGNSLHNRGQKHRLYDVAVCVDCDVRFWIVKTHLGRADTRCPACRIEDAA